MGRKPKVGLDYFELDCHLDEKIRLIQAEYGLKGLAVIVLLLQRIYGEQGYYMIWDDDRSLLFMSDNGIPSCDTNLIREIVDACIRRHIFSSKLFDKYGILTSSGIQKRYLNAVARRGEVEIKKEYLLVEVGQKTINVVENKINDSKNEINDSKSTQRREEKKREDNNKYVQEFDRLWACYPRKQGKKNAFSAYCKARRDGVSFEEVQEGLNQYVGYIKRCNVDSQYIKQGSTFFIQNSWGDDWSTGRGSVKKNLNNYGGRDYEAVYGAEFEKRLLANVKTPCKP